MIIKHPAPHHKESLISLWIEAFHESRESAETFFASAFSPARSMVCLEEDAVVAGLYWFDCLWGEKKVAYLYAVATKKSHRGKGICSKLMQKTHETLKERNYHGAILVPAEDSLFAFYARMGYTPCCPGAIPRSKIICHCEHSEESVPNSQLYTLNSQLNLTPIPIEEYLQFQKNLLPKDAVLHTSIAYNYLKHFGEFYKTENGILCKIEEDIQERLPHIPEGEMASMYLPLTEDRTLPTYFAHPLA